MMGEVRGIVFVMWICRNTKMIPGIFCFMSPVLHSDIFDSIIEFVVVWISCVN